MATESISRSSFTSEFYWLPVENQISNIKIIEETVILSLTYNLSLYL